MRSFVLALVSSLLLTSASASPSLRNEAIVESNQIAAWGAEDVYGLEKRHYRVHPVEEYSHSPTEQVIEKSVQENIETGLFGFRCGKKFFNQKKIMRAAEAACPKLSDNSQKHTFPAAHTATSYPVEGPYFEWPISRYGGVFNVFHHWSKGKYRIVLTTNCKVVGAVKRNKKDRSYEQCKLERH